MDRIVNPKLGRIWRTYLQAFHLRCTCLCVCMCLGMFSRTGWVALRGSLNLILIYLSIYNRLLHRLIFNVFPFVLHLFLLLLPMRTVRTFAHAHTHTHTPTQTTCFGVFLFCFYARQRTPAVLF